MKSISQQFAALVCLLFGVSVLATLPGCSKAGPGPEIVCTTGMVADVVRNVVGDRHTVHQLMGEGVDPHSYAATPKDAAFLDSAGIIFYSGLHLEGKMTELFEDLARRKPVHALTEGLDASRILRDENGARDPHVWFDVALWSETTNVVRDALIAFDPEGSDVYRANARAYQKRLQQVHAETQEAIRQLPENRRILVTAHDAFGYFSRAYGIEVKSVQGISTEDEAGLKEVNNLVDFLVQRKVPAVFIETSVSDKNMKALVEGCQNRGHTIRIGGELFSDAMGAQGTLEGTYVGMVRKNVATIVDALR